MKKLIMLCFLLLGVSMQAKVVISQIMYDSPFNEQINKPPYSNGEFIEIYNAGAKDEVMSDWKLVGGGVTETYTFPDGQLLPSGQSTIVAYRHYATENFNLDSLFTKESNGIPYTVVYQRKIILSNTGEPLKLVAPNGIVVDSIYYSNSAVNNDNTPYPECYSLHRNRISLCIDGGILSDLNDWSVGLVCRGGDTPLEEFTYAPQSANHDTLPSKQNYRIIATPLDEVNSLSLQNGHVAPNVKSRILLTCDVYDGLGRPQLTIARRHSSELLNTCTLAEYDARNNMTNFWLPIPYHGDTVFAAHKLKTEASLYYDDSHPYTTTTFEQSPLSRQTAITQEGAIYQSHPATIEYGTNGENEVIRWQVASNGLLRCGYYPHGSLYKTISVNEDGKKTIEYKDYQDRLILQKQGSDAVWASTYYVYDDYSRLTYVLPPNILGLLQNNSLYYETNPAMRKFAYVYHYDSRDLLISKKLPGCEEIKMIYDKSHKLILSQDGNQRTRGNYWLYYAYDNTGRLLYQAEVQINSSYAVLTQTYKTQNCVESFAYNTMYNHIGYSISAISYNSFKPLWAYYYDDYSFMTYLPTAIRDSLAFRENSVSDDRYLNTKRLKTGLRIYNLFDNNSKVYSFYYDTYQNVVQTHMVGNADKHYSCYVKYNHDGTISYSKEINNAHVEVSSYIYDHAGRLRKHLYQLDSIPQIALSHYFYDETGHLAQKLLHDGQMKNQYMYDMRSQLSVLQSGPFSESIHRAESLPPDVNALYDGSISAVTESYPELDMRYHFQYDGLSRVTQSVLKIGEVSNPSEQFAYDLQGNILSLQRYDGDDLIDDLSMSYNGNQVVSIEESAMTLANMSRYGYTDRSHLDTTIRYDANGNMRMDLDRNITAIKYNLLNLPDTIIFSTGDSIINEYNASGEKISRSFCSSNNYRQIILYDKNIETTYSRLANESEWIKEKEVVYNNEGYNQYIFSGTTPHHSQYYYCRDYLGNNVAVWNSDTRQIEQQTLYYITGLPMNNSTGDDLQAYKYNSKELIARYGLNEYDSQARMYYVTIMQTTTMDPLAEKYYHISPYAWCGNNPVNRYDPDGKAWYLPNGFPAPNTVEACERSGEQLPLQWTDYKSQEEMDKAGIMGVFYGEAVIVFDGYKDEHFGTKNGRGKYLGGEGAKLADVTLYGPNGADDITTGLHGFTMTSDYDKYGAIDDGIYWANYDVNGKSGDIKSHWVLNNRGWIPQYDYQPNLSPFANYMYETMYKDNIFIHSTLRSNNLVGDKTSVGCLLLDWTSMRIFNKKMSGVRQFSVQVKRQ